MDDHTGRIRRAGGIGPDFQIGSGHETEFFYSTPSQEELDRLFGSEVGYAPHYQRRITVDANEQFYIEYFDMAGRVVASGLAGATPANPDAPGKKATFSFTPTITLLKNNYILTKTLTVDQDAINGYWCTYLENNTCVPTFQELYNEAYANADFSSCDIEEEFDEDDYSCDVMRAIMLNDVSPGGQYAEYTVSGSTYSAANTISVLYTGGSPDLSGDWRTPSGGMYEDELGAQAWVEVQLISVGVYAPPVEI